MIETYINKEIQGWIDKLIDLFCLQDNIPKVILKPRTNNMSGRCMPCGYNTNSIIEIGCKGGLRLTTLVHEFLHADEIDHQPDINGYSNYGHIHDDPRWRYRNGVRRYTDTYSPLIVQDLIGKKELIL